MQRVRVISTKQRPVTVPCKAQGRLGVPGGLTWLVMRRFSLVVALVPRKVKPSLAVMTHISGKWGERYCRSRLAFPN